MTTKHNVTRADEVFLGGANNAGAFSQKKRVGVGPIKAVVEWEVNPVDEGVEIASAQTPTAAEFLALDGTTTLDFERGVKVVSSGDATNIVATVAGLDMYGEPLVEEITGLNAGSALSKKTFKTITSLYVNGVPTTGTIQLVTSKYIGNAFRIAREGDILKIDEYANAAAVVATQPGTSAERYGVDVQTATSEGVRGSLLFNDPYDGTAIFRIQAVVPTGKDAYGVAQYAG